ncbi:MAG: hypothetical protein JXJ04_18090 [Spirochaetales bacterium]|nr:hypothetical protein [Spirochaetales bacterium]
MGRVTDWNPRISYQFLSHFNIVRENQLQTLNALADWMRGHLVHYTNNTEDLNSIYNYPGFPPVDRILYPTENRPHLTAGCRGTTGIFCALLRALNIPVKAETIDLGGTHSQPEFVSLAMSMSHDDDVYYRDLDPAGGEIPSSVYFYTMDEMESYFFNPPLDCNEQECNSRGEQASYNRAQKAIINSLLYNGYAYLYEYAEFGEAYVRDSFHGPRINYEVIEYAQPFFTPQQIDAKINLIRQRLIDMGGGNIETGKEYVKERMELFWNNKLNRDG